MRKLLRVKAKLQRHLMSQAAMTHGSPQRPKPIEATLPNPTCAKVESSSRTFILGTLGKSFENFARMAWRMSRNGNGVAGEQAKMQVKSWPGYLQRLLCDHLNTILGKEHFQRE